MLTHKIALFSKYNLTELETEVNTWLEKNQLTINVLSITFGPAEKTNPVVTAWYQKIE